MILHDIDHAVFIEVTIRHPQRFLECIGVFIFAVTTPVAGHDVQSAVAIEITQGHAVPPALVAVQAKGFGGIGEFAGIVTQHHDRPPFQGQHQIGVAIQIQIAKDSAANQPQFFEGRIIHGIRLEFAVLIQIQE